MHSKVSSFATGFILLFVVYHFPEFFQSFWITALFKIGFLAVAFMVARRQGWRGLGGFGLPLTANGALTGITGILIGFIAFTLSILLSVGLNFVQITGVKSPGFFFHIIPLTLLMTFFPSIAEDILARGYLFAHLKQLKPTWWILVSALVFVLNHIWRLNAGAAVLSYLFILGLVLAFCVISRQSLWLAFGVHWGSNIAFELSTTGITLKDTAYPQASNWCLAAVWAFVLVVFIATHFWRVIKGQKKVI